MSDTLQEISPLARVTNPRQISFLKAFATSMSVTDSADAARINRRTHYDWLRNDSTYSAAIDELKRQFIDEAEREAWRRAKEGTDEPVFFQGVQCGTVRKYSDTLLMFLLRAAAPERYRESAIAVGGAQSLTVVFNRLPDHTSTDAKLIDGHVVESLPDGEQKNQLEPVA